MENNKTEQYTFAPEEKEILQKMDVVEASVNAQNIQEKNQREIVATKYYSEFVINTEKGQIPLKNVFITAEQDQNGKTSYHFRWINENEKGEQVVSECLAIDADGKVKTSGDLAKYLGEELDIEDLMESNNLEKGRLKGVSEKISKIEKDEQDNSKEEMTQEIDEDLKEQGQELGLTNIREIKDIQDIKERMPEAFGDSDEHAQGYSQTLGKFVMVEKVQDGGKSKWQLNEKVEPSQPTLRKIISIDEKGKNIEKEVPHALMKTNRSDKEIAVTYGPYGTVNIQTVDVLPCQERVARQVREQGEDGNGQEDAQIRRDFKAGGKEYTHDLAHQVNEIEEMKENVNQKPVDQISETDYIPNTDTTWKELMEETGESLPDLINRYNDDMSNEESQKSDVWIKKVKEDSEPGNEDDENLHEHVWGPKYPRY